MWGLEPSPQVQVCLLEVEFSGNVAGTGLGRGLDRPPAVAAEQLWVTTVNEKNQLIMSFGAAQVFVVTVCFHHLVLQQATVCRSSSFSGSPRGSRSSKYVISTANPPTCVAM